MSYILCLLTQHLVEYLVGHYHCLPEFEGKLEAHCSFKFAVVKDKSKKKKIREENMSSCHCVSWHIVRLYTMQAKTFCIVPTSNTTLAAFVDRTVLCRRKLFSQGLAHL